MCARRRISTGCGNMPTQLDADVIAIQEVDGRAVAARLFPADRYSIHMTHDDVVQRVGIVVRRGLAYDVNPDVTAMDGDRTGCICAAAPISRCISAQDRCAHPGGASEDRLRRRVADAARRRRSCVELRAQVPPLQAWIAARQQEGVPFIVLGDFNRHMDGRDQLWAALSQRRRWCARPKDAPVRAGAPRRSSTTSSPAVRRATGCSCRHCVC